MSPCPEYRCAQCLRTFISAGSLRTHTSCSRRGLLRSCTYATDTVSRRGTYHTESDSYDTPLSAWADLIAVYPALRRMHVWDPFYNTGASSRHLLSLGVYRVTHTAADFVRKVKYFRGYDIIVTNPPFTTKARMLRLMLGTGKPFIVLLRMHVLLTKWFRGLMHGQYKLIIPRSRFKFARRLYLECVWVCHRCGPTRTLTVM